MSFPDLATGSRGPEVGNWQRFLKGHGYRDDDGRELIVDERFGPRSAAATRHWQPAHGLLPTGIVGMVERRLAQAEGFIPFLQAKNYKLLYPQKRAIGVVVIHDMEYPERPDGAEWCAGFFSGLSAPMASAHYSVDSNSIVQCVREDDVAYHAPGANHNGIGIEHAGYAKQSRAEWMDDYSLSELKISASLTAQICARWAIPVVRISAAELKAGARGICGHVDVTAAFSNGVGHYDPGPNFVWDLYLQWVKEAAAA